MNTAEDIKLVAHVLGLFLKAEDNKPWEKFDDSMWYLSFLTDDEIYREASIVLDEHRRFNARCADNHPAGQICPVQQILEAIDILLKNLENKKEIDVSSRYMLEYYVCLDQCQMILTD